MRLKKLISALCLSLLCVLFVGCTDEKKIDGKDKICNETNIENIFEFIDFDTDKLNKLPYVYSIPNELNFENSIYSLVAETVDCKLNYVIGHIIKKDYEDTYKLLFPDLTPIICDKFKDADPSSDMLKIYSLEGDTESEFIAVALPQKILLYKEILK